MNKRDKYTESEKNTKRRNEVGLKLIKMGEALMEEGTKNDDFCVLSAGNQLILLSGLITSPKDMEEFGNLCTMFTAKRIMDDMMSSPLGPIMLGGLEKGENLIDTLKKFKNDSDSNLSSDNTKE